MIIVGLSNKNCFYCLIINYVLIAYIKLCIQILIKLLSLDELLLIMPVDDSEVNLGYRSIANHNFIVYHNS